MNSNPGAEDQVLEHTPLPWRIHIDDDDVALSIRADEDGWSYQEVAVAGRDDVPTCQANAKLLALAPTAPHRCNVPDCPGPKNLARLNAAAGLARLAELIADLEPGKPYDAAAIAFLHSCGTAALAAYRAAQPETAGGNDDE